MSAASSEDRLGEKLQLLMKLRTGGFRDTQILSAIEAVPRENFVPRMFGDKAYADESLPIEMGQSIERPRDIAVMIASLEIGPRHHLLEVGTGSGYVTAVLSQLAKRVYGIERHRELAALAEERLRALDIANATVKPGDGSLGWPEVAPFDRILVTASAPQPPTALREQLKDEGILVMPIGPVGTEQMLTRYRKQGGELAAEPLATISAAPLIAGKVPS